jgi:SAM-dependent methyltransferase
MSKRRDLVPPEWFDELYARDGDPWEFATSDYERDKYAATLGALSRPFYRRGFEIGCSVGVLTQQLAARVGRLLAVDVVESALQAARERCRDLASVDFKQMRVPDVLPAGPFDLIMVSEVAYYLDRARLNGFAAWLCDSVSAGGECVLVHWTGETDYPLTADDVHDTIIEATKATLSLRRTIHTQRYRLDVLGRSETP